MKKLMVFTSSLFVLLFMACNDKKDHSPVEFEPGVSFNLSYKDTGNCSCGDLSITFVDVVEDVHPAAGVPDVWEGESRIQLDVLSSDGAQSIQLIYRLTKSSFDRDTVGNYAISLMQVSPYPRMGQTVNKEDYDIKLMVEEL